MRQFYKVTAPIRRTDGETYHIRVGSAFTMGKSGDINVYIDALPGGATSFTLTPTPRVCPVCDDGACETKSEECGK